MHLASGFTIYLLYVVLVDLPYHGGAVPREITLNVYVFELLFV
jgi:hypothetical protein